MTRHGIVDNETRKVVNIVVWEGAEWSPPKNHIVVQHDEIEIGDSWDMENNVLIPLDRSSKEE